MRIVPATAQLRVGNRERGSRVGTDRLPANLIYPPMYRDLLHSMLHRSPTFQRQCLRLAHARQVTVTLRSIYPNARLASRARTNIVRVDSGFDATVDVPPLEDTIELIAHELEHVIEQIDGIDLKAQAALDRTGVTAGGDGTFETMRAARIGHRVAHEMRRPRQPGW